MSCFPNRTTTSPGRRPAFAAGLPATHACQLHTFDFARIVGNRAEPDAELPGRRRGRRGKLAERRVFPPVGHPDRASLDQAKHVRLPFRVDLVGRVARLVVIGMSAGEEKQHRNVREIEGLLIARAESALGFLERKPRTDLAVRRNDERLPGGRCSHSDDREFPVAQPPDHVHVEHRDGGADRNEGIAEVMDRTEEPELFARKRQKNDASLRPVRPRREVLRERDHSRRPGGVVVGAGVDGGRGSVRERARASHSEVIVMSADDDVLVPENRVAPFEQRGDVVG